MIIGTLPHVSSAPNLQMLRPQTDSESSGDEKDGNDACRVDKIYTVGCFDLLHWGHEKLFKNMRRLGREVWYYYKPVPLFCEYAPYESTQKCNLHGKMWSVHYCYDCIVH